MSKIMQAALDPSCLACLTPLGWYSPLRQGVVWPGPPRNFATEPARWYDFIRFASSVPVTDDFLFRIRFTLEQSMLGTTWYLFAGDVCSLMINNSGNVYWYCTMGVMPVFSNITLVLLEMINTPGTYEITARIVGDTVRLDGVRFNTDGSVADAKSVMGSITSRVAASGSFTKSQFSGTISSIEMQNTTTGDRISYPSISEHLRLTTNTNVREVNGHWEAADPAVAARIDTGLDLRGKVSDYTVIVDFEAALAADNQKQELLGQGSALGAQAAICAMAYVRVNNAHRILVSQEINGARNAFSVVIPAITGRHVAAATIRRVESSTVIGVYMDGAFIASTTVSGVPSGTAFAAFTTLAINDNRNGSTQNFFGKIYAAALFNEALTAGQIAYLSN